jgi:hypothetical protein
MLERAPSAAFLGTGHGLRDKVHPVHAIRYIGIQALACIHLFPVPYPQFWHMFEAKLVR